MPQLAKTHDTRTLDLPKPEGDLLRVLLALTHQSKNLKNSGNYLIRQVESAYAYDRETELSTLKAGLHPGQVDAIAHVNAAVDEVNRKRTLKHPAQVDKAKAKHLAEGKPEDSFKPPQLKLIERLERVTANPSGVVLDPTVLDNAARTRLNEHGDVIYRRLPAAMAQQALARVREGFFGYFAAKKRFNADPSDMTGRPQRPGYLDKHERFVLEMPFAQIHGALPPLKGRNIPEDDFVLNPLFLTEQMIGAFDGYDVKAAILGACRKRGWNDCQPQHLRIVPMRKTVRLEVVVRIANPYPAGSFLATVVAQHGAELAALKDDKARDAWLLAHLGGLPATALPRIAGMDMGKSNLVAVAYSTGRKAAVHTGGRFNANMQIFTDRIAARVSFLTPERAKLLQAKKLALQKTGEKLGFAEEIELRTLLKALYEDDEYRRLVGRKERWVKDFLHKLSASIVSDCADRKIEVIVVGQNKGWKQEVEMGREQNRGFCQIAHATLIENIRYKAESHGIAVVATEESYTSKTSFVNDDELECHADKTTQDAASTIRPVRTGCRSSEDRNWFRHKNRDDRLKWVHADVNGAFNIVRKVFRNFKYHAGLTLKFTLLRLSPRVGVVPLTA